MTQKLKKVFLFTLAFGLASLLPSNAQAQKENHDNKNHISINAGLSLTSGVFKVALNGDSVKYHFSSTPTVALNYDYFVNHWLSIGGGFARQAFQITFDEYIDNKNVLQTGDFHANFKRNQIHFKFLANKTMAKTEVYGGLRLGFLWYRSDLSFEKRELAVLNKVDKILNFGRPTLGIPMGVRYYLTQNLGVNAELNLGAPYILSGGASIKF